MPNWCAGTFKIRGKEEDIVRFLEECLIAIDRDDGNKEYHAKVVTTICDEISAIYPEEFKGYRGGFWIKDSRRHFIGDDGKLYAFMCGGDEKTVVFEKFRSAWQIDEEPFKGMAERYNIDIRLEGFDCNTNLHQIVECSRNGTVNGKVIKYDDWEWECPCPNMGG